MDAEQQSRLFELADLILAVSRHVNAAKESQAESGTPLEGAVMRYVDRHPGATVGDAAQATQMISSNLSRAVRGLVDRGLLRREPDPDDARRVRLFPTDSAHDNLERLRSAWSRLFEGTLDEASEYDAVIVALRRIEQRLVAGKSIR